MTQTEKRAREIVSRRATLTNNEWLQLVADLVEEIEYTKWSLSNTASVQVFNVRTEEDDE